MAFPLTFQDIQNDVITRLRLGATADLAKVKDWINQAYSQACLEAEFPRTTSTAGVTIGNTSVALPTAVARLRSIVISTGEPMIPVDYEMLLHLRSQDTAQGTPTHYSVLQSTVEFWKAASGSFTLTFGYVKQPTALSANGDLPVIDEPYASKLLTYGALVEGADFLENPNLPNYRAAYEDWLARFKDHLYRRSGDQMEQRLVLQKG